MMLGKQPAPILLASRLLRVSLLVLLTSLFLSACSTTHYRESADREARRVIAEKTPRVPGMDPEFTIEQAAMPAAEELPPASGAAEFLGEAAQTEANARVVSLERALALGVQHNRDYQKRKEALYLQALDLTLARHDYRPIFSGRTEGDYSHTTRDVTGLSKVGQAAQDVPSIIAGIGQLTGTPGDLISTYQDLAQNAIQSAGWDKPQTRIVDEHSVSGTSNFGIDVLLRGGTRIAVDLTSNFLRFVTGDPRATATSALAATITQPLLRGAGRKVAAERLTQAERDLLYELRDFARYRQEFTVKICSDYYGALQSRDVVRNNWQSYQSFSKNTERERAFAAEGQRTQSEVGRLEQAMLSNENQWIESIRRYKQQLDQFKIELGLSADDPIILDDAEMRRLKEAGIIHLGLSSEDAVKVALASRLDLFTQKDQREDAERKVHVAANALKPKLDLTANATVPSRSGDRFTDADFRRTQWGAGLGIDLPFDRKPERNSYRASLIARDRAARDVELAADNVKLEVRNSWRTLDQAKRAYAIALKGVELNKRRVEEQSLLAELGRATALNQVDAQNDLTQAENNLTAALVSHTIARIQFWRDMGILFIKPDGQWQEVTDVPVPSEGSSAKPPRGHGGRTHG